MFIPKSIIILLSFFQVTINNVTDGFWHFLYTLAPILLVCWKTIVFGRTYVLRMMFFKKFFPSMRSPRCVGRPAWNFARWSVLGRIL